eukprot:752888-Hanusia_phi.AAC.4
MSRDLLSGCNFGGTYTISDLELSLYVQFLEKPVDAECLINDLHIYSAATSRGTWNSSTSNT